MNLLQKLYAIFTPSQKKVPMDNSQQPQTQLQTQPQTQPQIQPQVQQQNILDQASNILDGIKQAADLATLIPGAAGAASTVKDAVLAAQEVEPAVENVLAALLPLLHAAGHEIGAEWESLVAAAKTLAK